jgi:hypothetical protein
MIKSLKKLEIEGTHLNIIAVYNKPIVNSILNGEKLKPFSLVRNETRVSILPLFNIVLQFLTGLKKARERKKKLKKAD